MIKDLGMPNPMVLKPDSSSGRILYRRIKAPQAGSGSKRQIIKMYKETGNLFSHSNRTGRPSCPSALVLIFVQGICGQER